MHFYVGGDFYAGGEFKGDTAGAGVGEFEEVGGPAFFVAGNPWRCIHHLLQRGTTMLVQAFPIFLSWKFRSSGLWADQESNFGRVDQWLLTRDRAVLVYAPGESWAGDVVYDGVIPREGAFARRRSRPCRGRSWGCSGCISRP